MLILILRLLFFTSIPCALVGIAIIFYLSASYSAYRETTFIRRFLVRLDRLPNTPRMNRLLLCSLWSLALLLTSGGLFKFFEGDRSNPWVFLVLMGVLLFVSSAVIVGPYNGRPWTLSQGEALKADGKLMVTHVLRRRERMQSLLWTAVTVALLFGFLAWLWPLR